MTINASDQPPAPANAPLGPALTLVSSTAAAELTFELQRLGYDSFHLDEPYAALLELLDRPLVYRALVISLPALYRDELSLIRTVRHCLPHLDVLLAHTDGRHAALAEAMRLGATGLLSDDTVHRLAETAPLPDANASAILEEPSDDESFDDTGEIIEPILTAEELRALLHEQPSLPEQS